MTSPNEEMNDPAVAREKVRESLLSGNFQETERLLRLRLEVAPDDYDAIVALGDVAIQTGRPLEAAMLFRQALGGKPEAHNAAVARHKLGTILQQRGEYPEALALLEQLPPDWRLRFQVRGQLAVLLGMLGRRDEEIAAYRSLIEEQPDNPVLWQLFGNALNYAGNYEEAVAALRRATAIRPEFGGPWWSLANLKSFRFENADIDTMRSVLRGGTAPADAMHIHFALGRALETGGDYAGSFQHYDAGNRTRLAMLRPEEAEVPEIDPIIEPYSFDIFARHAGVGDPSEAPIFIVGLPRSGSTLIEQILASHSMIEATTELSILGQLLAEAGGPRGIVNASPKELADIGLAYLDRAKPFRHLGRPRFIDKQPANWSLVGMIRLILPNAKIIDARREPMACGFSNFKQLYAIGGHFSYTQEGIGRFYRGYLRMMRHFDRVQPGAVYRCLHDRLVDDLEGEVRRMLNYLGLPFEASCLEFHRTRRAVNTPSADQVRQPIDREAGKSWRPYEQWLGPLMDSLGPDLHDWRT